MFKTEPKKTEAMKINHFHAILRKKRTTSIQKHERSDQKALDVVLLVFRRKYVKAESHASAKHKRHKLTFHLKTNSLSDLQEELNEFAERACGDNTQHMIDNLLYAKLSTHLEQSFTLAYLEKRHI